LRVDRIQCSRVDFNQIDSIEHAAEIMNRNLTASSTAKYSGNAAAGQCRRIRNHLKAGRNMTVIKTSRDL
jgi:hypothetical protein